MQVRISSPEDLAGLYFEVVPKAMREFRREMRAGRGPKLTVPQFRVLAQLSVEAANNRTLAETQGLSLAAVSRMVDWLVRHHWVERVRDERDRRQVLVRLTENGSKRFDLFCSEAQNRLKLRMLTLKPSERRDLKKGLRVLSNVVEKMGSVAKSN